ncbi:polysaccharide deacetylase family protein [Streptomyces sp. NPDC008313]|uniref:polysaccharide deacetylase family protein n=1 Tax=Streptomyces sp. NPDC008313 TaxID=3364826 RepID=UPI0036E1011A
MKKDQLLTRRRVLTAGVAALGAASAASAAHLLAAGPDPGPAHASAAAGPQTHHPQGPSAYRAYRLRPLAGNGPPHLSPPRTAVRRKPILRVPGHGRSMVLSFDDGPDPSWTPDILRTLRRYDVRAMFFVCGEMASYNKDLLREMADDGHVVGNHTWGHPLLTRMSRRAIRSEMERTCEVIEDACGRPPLWFRAPYGAWNRAAFQLGAELGMEPMAWTLDTRDWTRPGTRAIVHAVEEGAGRGVVVLSHDAGGNRSQSARALRRYLPWLLDSGYHLTVPRREREWT